MPRISTYITDSNINPEDRLLGSDDASGNKPTRQYRIGDLIDFIASGTNTDGLGYRYSQSKDKNTSGYFSTDNTAIRSVTEIYLNNITKEGIDATQLFKVMKDDVTPTYFKIADSKDPSKIAYFNINAIDIQAKNAYVKFSVTLMNTLGYGSFAEEKDYYFVLDVVTQADVPTKTSQLENDGEDGNNPFITLSDVYQGNKLINYGIYNVENYNYFVWADRYIINNVEYSEYLSDTVTLNDGDATYDRIDVIVINADRTITVIEGTPSDDPVKPTVDSETQLEVTFVIVTANSTSPSEVETTVMYDEDLQESNEWNTEGVVSRVITNSTEQAFSGTKSIKFNTSVFNDRLRLSSTTGFVKTDVDVLVFAIKTSSEPILRIYFEPSGNNPTIARGIPLYIIDGNYGYDKNVTDWQVIVIPIQDFNLSNGTYKALQFTNKLNFGTSTFFIDKIFLQKHGGNGGNTGNYLISTNNLNDVENADTARENIKAQRKSGSYGTIPLMLADQASQTDQQIIEVTNASGDSNITFAVGETKLQAYYQFLGVATGDIDDYRLVSAPYGNHGIVDVPTLEEVLTAGNTATKQITTTTLGTTYEIGSNYGIRVKDASKRGVITQYYLTIGNLSGTTGFYLYPTKLNIINTNQDYLFPRSNWFVVSTSYRLSTEEYTSRKQIKTVSASTYTLLSTDKDLIIHFTHATGCTVTVPASLPINNRYEGKQRGDGQITFVGAGGVTINVGASETNKTLERFSVWGLDCVATDEYDLFGKLELV